MNRRAFLEALMVLTAGLLVPNGAARGEAPARRDRLGPLLPLRKLGRTGVSVTMLGLGGSHVGMMSERDGQATIEAALEGGVRFFDTANNYQGGESERRYGKFLVPAHRDAIVLMTKTMAYDGASARRHLDDSLRRLGTDHLDLWQIHSVASPDDVERRISAGVLDAMLDAKKRGRARHVGFTGHAAPLAHRRMLARTRALETCQMPVNVLDPAYESFIEGVLPALVGRGMGVLAMKTLANGGLLGRPNNFPSDVPRAIPDRLSVAEALHFVWSLPVSVLISGPNTPAQFRETIAIARAFKPLDAKRRAAVAARVADLGGRDVEYYKA
jgi:aryl-alcohol dehydrogenase-like predicted oxidoreductase